ncbi:MAG TPA: ubiquinone/menaquinone biosynthesis methyltransferase [Dongiaceae bacterium]|nr:ubiquinone/menaquinone biosynthesis methyltransferase [Dongiaceae bacterium]
MTDPPPTDPQRARFAPRAAREMAGMFDQVSRRYDWLNALMTLGQDGAWRTAMSREVPSDTVVVVDLCTGSGISTVGLRRAGRTVLGIDVSLRMLRAAENDYGGPGWAPRFVCADGFALPLRDGAVGAVTTAFGIRNLRPRADALAEIRRVLKPGGTLVILEATAPDRGPLAPLARGWIRHGIPWLGALSPDPSAYRYLSDSIFEFGAGAEMERDLEAAGFSVTGQREFLFGAARAWTARRPSGPGRIASVRPEALHDAMAARSGAEPDPAPAALRTREWRTWAWLNALVSATLLAALVWGVIAFAKWARVLPLQPWQRSTGWFLLAFGLFAFAIRTVILGRRALGPGPRP